MVLKIVILCMSIVIVCAFSAKLNNAGRYDHRSHLIMSLLSSTIPEGEPSPVVNITTQGLVRGTVVKDGASKYVMFLGIPYANASSENRFKIPLPVPTWDGIREANVEEISCGQYNRFNKQFIGQENCLVLNVYVPKNVYSGEKLPVMMYIHGGGYNEGSGEISMYGPRRFMEENIVLVTFNYRLGIFGFLCTGDTANLGLKDAVAVLEWIHANIESFGGDPKQVTIFGQSAGGSMVELLVLSKRTKGLFNRAIPMSGLTSATWAFGSDPEEKARRVAKQLGYEGDDKEERMRIMKNASFEDLIKFTENLALMNPFEYLPVTPCIEPASNPMAVVTEDPIKVIQSGDYNDVPLMQGFTKDEAMLIYGFPNFLDAVKKDFVYSLPKDLQSHPEAQKIADEVKRFYFGTDAITDASIPKAVDCFTDIIYVLSSVKSARRYIRSGRKSPLFMYEFAYDGGLPFYKRMINITHIPGVAHADDLGYMFTQAGVSSNRTDDDIIAKQLVKLWTNFAKFGDPTPETSELLPVKWTPVTEELDYLLIHRKLEMTRKPFPSRIDFWDGIYKKYLP